MYSIERYDEDIWVNIVSGAAYNQEEYVYEATTLADSTSTNDAIAFFRVIASMDEGVFISEEATGFSVDNIAPDPPINLSYSLDFDNYITITWDEVDANDLAYYAIYSNDELYFEDPDEIEIYENSYTYPEDFDENEINFIAFFAQVFGNPIWNFIVIKFFAFKNNTLFTQVLSEFFSLIN